jgi:lysyl-tRNA synthetase class I
VITASGGDGYGYYYYYHHKPTKKPTNYFAPIPNLLSEVYTRIRQKHQAQQADQETKASVYHVLSETKRILGEK